MSFWTIWIAFFTFSFLAIMIWVVASHWKSRTTADENKTLLEFDGVKENDGPAPRILFPSYAIAFSLGLGYFIFYPGIGEWEGVAQWSSRDVTRSEQHVNLRKKISQYSQTGVPSLSVLATDQGIVKTGEGLYRTHCAACHRKEGQGQLHFPNLVDDDWIYGGGDNAVLHSIEKGRHGAMAGYADILSTQEIDNITLYLVSFDKSRAVEATRFQYTAGEMLYHEHCATCHNGDLSGNSGNGALRLNDNIWLHGGSVEQIHKTIGYGLDNRMPHFENVLNPDEIFAVAAYITKLKKDNDVRLKQLDEAKIERGEYLAFAGDCVACHTAINGEPFAGGLPFATPFGVMFSTNITPHYDEGIGSWTYDDFKSALVDGKGRNGYLYPAMPYTSYQYVKEEDIQALWAYVQSVTPIPKRNEHNTVMFPANIRLGMLGWNILFMDTETLDYGADKSERWQRGKYLVMGLGHCSECHTPRNLAQAMELDNIFEGNIIEGWQAPSITAKELYEDGWDIATLSDFLQTGHSDKGSAFGGMAEVVRNSTQHMTRDDIEAMADYLITGDVKNELPEGIVPIVAPGFTETAMADESYDLFLETCGVCHGQDGRGREGIAPTLLYNGIIQHSDPYDTVAVTIRGLSPDYMTLDSNYVPMASFNNVISDNRLAKLVTFVRTYLGGRTESVDHSYVEKVRETLVEEGLAGNIHISPSTDDRPNTLE